MFGSTFFAQLSTVLNRSVGGLLVWDGAHLELYLYLLRPLCSHGSLLLHPTLGITPHPNGFRTWYGGDLWLSWYGGGNRSVAYVRCFALAIHYLAFKLFAGGWVPLRLVFRSGSHCAPSLVAPSVSILAQYRGVGLVAYHVTSGTFTWVSAVKGFQHSRFSVAD